MQVSPFRNLRIIGYVLLPEAFRSLSRLSSALSAKASTLRSCKHNQLDVESGADSDLLRGMLAFPSGSFDVRDHLRSKGYRNELAREVTSFKAYRLLYSFSAHVYSVIRVGSRFVFTCFLKCCNHYNSTLFITITSDVLILIFDHYFLYAIFKVHLTDFISHQKPESLQLSNHW